MNVERAYDKWAESYDSMRNETRDMDRIATSENLSCVKFQSVLEVGCGTGKNTEWLAPRCSKLVAVDFSLGMLAIAKRKVSHKHIEWNRFDISESWPIQDLYFDVITFNLVLEHVRDLTEVFSEAANRLASGGIMHISELHPFKQYLGSKARFDSEHETHELEAFTHHVSDYTSALADVGLAIKDLKEWFDSGRTGVPRLLTLLASSNP